MWNTSVRALAVLLGNLFIHGVFFFLVCCRYTAPEVVRAATTLIHSQSSAISSSSSCSSATVAVVPSVVAAAAATTTSTISAYDESCDLWSLGVILYTMLSGEVPFNSTTAHRTAEEIVEDITRSKLSYDTSAWRNVSQAAKDLVKGLLTVDPSKRLTMKNLARNAWLRGSCVPFTHDHLMTPSILCQASRSLIVSFLASHRIIEVEKRHLFQGTCCECHDASISKSWPVSVVICD